MFQELPKKNKEWSKLNLYLFYQTNYLNKIKHQDLKLNLMLKRVLNLLQPSKS